MKLVSLFAALVCSSVAFAAPEKVQLDLSKSVIKWKGGKEFTNDSHTGTVAIKSGYVEVEKGSIIGGEFEIDMNKMENTDLTDAGYKAKLVGHLQAADFFDTQKFPTAKFKITKVTKTTDKTLIEGDMTIKGKTSLQRINTTITKDGKVYVAKGATDFDRTKYDVKYNSQSFFPDLVKTGKDKVIKNNIDLEFELRTQATNQ